jgi:hypothetical protein
MAYAEAYIRVTEPDGSEWISVAAFDEVLDALKGLAALVRTPDEFASAQVLAARAVIAKAESPPA